MKRTLKILTLICVIILVSFLFANRIWSNKLVRAILDNDLEKVEILLESDVYSVNFPGRDADGHSIRPISRACMEYYSDEKVIQALLYNGAKVYQKDYFYEATDVDEYCYKKLKLLIKYGPKPVISSNKMSPSLLDYVAGTDLTFGKDIYGVDTDEWEENILNSYQILYYSGMIDDKRKELESSLKYAKDRKNEPLIEFINSELAKLE